MRLRLTLALTISILLIGVAFWSRFNAFSETNPNILALEQPASANLNEEMLIQEFSQPDEIVELSSTKAPAKPLTNTDLVSRQLLMDYVALAAKGQATPGNIDMLANQYVENVPALHQAKTILFQDIKLLPNNETTFSNYAIGLGKIYEEHGSRIDTAYANAGSIGTLQEVYALFAGTAATIYEDTSFKLENLPVPISLASKHLEIINTQLSSAAAMKAIHETNKDPLTAFAGIIALNEVLDKEVLTLKEIEQLLKTDGI